MSEYELVDSGEGEKLERFGEHLIARPSSVCCWKKKRSDLWKQAAASFVPKQGWKKSGKIPDQWIINYCGCEIIIRLLENGQLGLFPEHGSYLSKIDFAGKQVLNLFAYTGLASVYALRHGAQLTHVDLSKKAIGWARENIALLPGAEPAVKYITDDAVIFAEREARRGKKYDILIMDPPSFSRVSKNSYWEIEEMLRRLLAASKDLVDARYVVALTCHDPGVTAQMLANLLSDHFDGDIELQELGIPENQSSRVLPAGSFALARKA